MLHREILFLSLQWIAHYVTQTGNFRTVVLQTCKLRIEGSQSGGEPRAMPCGATDRVHVHLNQYGRPRFEMIFKKD